MRGLICNSNTSHSLYQFAMSSVIASRVTNGWLMVVSRFYLSIVMGFAVLPCLRSKDALPFNISAVWQVM